MERIARKSLLNKSALGFYAINHVQGCSHGCLYPCYAFSMARGYGRAKDYEDWCKPALVSNAAELLEKELGRLEARVASGREERPGFIHLCLTTDPFMMGAPEVGRLSLELVRMINARGIPVSILTKGLLPPELSDMSLYPMDNSYGISLVSLSEEFRERWEPGASPYAERIAALKRLHESGRATLVHMEPYPTPNLSRQSLGELLEAVGFADRLYFGGWNHSPRAREFPSREDFYREQASFARSFCEKRGMRFEGGA
jgi:DNA repair photolyase